MDSLTQALLGASIGGVVAPRGQRRKGIVVGALLGTLPDMDVLIDYGGAVENFTYHRGFSHSLFFLAPFSVFLWLILKTWWKPAKDEPKRWLLLIAVALLTHPLLDAHTAYGTQLFWPLEFHPTMWATLFIIDPIYTLPLLVGVLALAIRPEAETAIRLIRSALVLSTIYIGWSWMAQITVSENVKAQLANDGMAGAPVFLTPTPFNTLLWRIVVLTDEGYLEGFDSLMVDEARINFQSYPSDQQNLDTASDIWAVARLRWFSQDFLKASVVDERLLITDLRMGLEPDYVFTHAVAQREEQNWNEINTELLPANFDRAALSGIWDRIWNE